VKASVLNLGCKVNQAESSQIEANLRSAGWSIVELSEGPELCVINTCSVTSKSDYQSRQLIRRAHRAGARILVTGCYSELNAGDVSVMSGVTRVIRNSEKAAFINELAGNRENSFDYGVRARSRAFLKIQDGCNYSCTYCIIPKARGRSKSVSPDSVISQAEKLSLMYHEIVLTGIHLGTYGYDLNPKVKLSDLTKALLHTSIKRIRLSSLEINEIDDDLIELLAEERVCSHLHMPLQSGSDRILKLMNRSYDSLTFMRRLQEIREKLPGISIGTDVIVGFPGEDVKDFSDTYSLIESLPFSYLHVFPYSPRPGTRAAAFETQISPDMKKDRCYRLAQLGREKRYSFMNQQLGTVLDTLIEKTSADGRSVGTTANYLKVTAVLERTVPGEIVRIRIVGHDGERLLGTSDESLLSHCI